MEYIMEDITQVVYDYYEISSEELLLNDKKTILARQVAMYLSRSITGGSFFEIGRKFGKDHAVIMYSCEKIELKMVHDKQLVATVELLKKEITKTD